MKNPSKILIEEIYNKKSQIKLNDNDDVFFKNLLLEEKIDFDQQKILLYNQNKAIDENKSDNKKVSKHLFF